jgi:hypothetical protein
MERSSLEQRLLDAVADADHLPVRTLVEDGADINARCDYDSTCDLTVVRPDGSTMHRFPGLELWKKEAPPSVQLGAAVPQIQFGSDDPAGTFIIRAIVRDEKRHVTLWLETTLDLM